MKAIKRDTKRENKKVLNPITAVIELAVGGFHRSQKNFRKINKFFFYKVINFKVSTKKFLLAKTSL